VGQFTRLMAFIRGRGAGDTAVGFADENPLDYLTVETPSITGVASTEMVAGAVDAGASRVRFRENYYIPMLDKVENALGAWFSASRAGDYVVHINGELTDDVVHTVSFSADFLELRKIKVKSLTVTPAVSPAKPLFETQRVPFAIAGDNSADYRLRYKGTPPAAAGTFDRLRFTVPLLPSAAVATHTLEITATYAATHPVFSGSGQNGAARLIAEQRTNVCQELVLTIAPLVAPSIGPVRAGSSTPFTLPIAPASVRVTSAKPAGAAVNASVLNGTGDPVQLKFIAPNAVTAATDVTFDLVFGAGAVTKTLHVTVHVTP
jgi:hypothetical protein